MNTNQCLLQMNYFSGIGKPGTNQRWQAKASLIFMSKDSFDSEPVPKPNSYVPFASSASPATDVLFLKEIVRDPSTRPLAASEGPSSPIGFVCHHFE